MFKGRLFVGGGGGGGEGGEMDGKCIIQKP